MGELSEQEQQYQLQLAHAGGFTLEDLEANRAGRLSERQMKERKRGCLILTLIGIGVGVFSFGVGLVFIILWLMSGKGIAEGNYSVGPAGVIQGLIIVGVCIYLRKRYRARPEESLQISFIEGIPARSKTGKIEAKLGGLQYFYYRFEDGTKIMVSEELYNVLQERQPHRIYCFHKNTMLSIEVLPMSWNPAGSKIKGIVERMEG